MGRPFQIFMRLAGPAYSKIPSQTLIEGDFISTEPLPTDAGEISLRDLGANSFDKIILLRGFIFGECPMYDPRGNLFGEFLLHSTDRITPVCINVKVKKEFVGSVKPFIKSLRRRLELTPRIEVGITARLVGLSTARKKGEEAAKWGEVQLDRELVLDDRCSQKLQLRLVEHLESETVSAIVASRFTAPFEGALRHMQTGDVVDVRRQHQRFQDGFGRRVILLPDEVLLNDTNQDHQEVK
jgi:hypothetical protein